MGQTKISTGTALGLAAVLLSSSTAAFVVARVPAHSVGAKQLKTSAVTNSKIAPSAVSNSKIRKAAVTASKVKPNSLGPTQIKESALGQVPRAGFALSAGNSARLENKGSADFVGAPRIAFGKGSATSPTVDTVLTLPNVGMTVTTDGNTDAASEIEVTVPVVSSPALDWYFSPSNDDSVSSSGGTRQFSVPNSTAVHELTVHIWRNSSKEGIYLHCSFDTGNSLGGARPFSCWAMST
jgi:hypothetical protein